MIASRRARWSSGLIIYTLFCSVMVQAMFSEASNVSSQDLAIQSPPTPASAYQLLSQSPGDLINCQPNQVVITLTTTLVIPDFSGTWGPTPIIDFKGPVYLALGDGSLVTPIFTQDLLNANLSLLVTGALAMLFVRNIFVSADYIRRGKVKRKILFYILFLSQVLAPLSVVPVILSYFYKWTDCKIVIILSCLSGTVSLALLITGILGVKAYRCLSNPPFVLVMLIIFQLSSFALSILDVITARAVRRISSGCIRTSNLRYTRYFVIVQFLESLFLCCCFLYACWKARGSPAVRGRISLELSMENLDNLPINVRPDADDTNHSNRRGWWNNSSTPEIERPSPAKLHVPYVLRRAFSIKQRNDVSSRARSSLEKQSAYEDLRRQPTTMNQSNENSNTRNARQSLTPSSGSRISRFSRLIPPMILFREVMKDELFYTTFITASCVFVAVFALIGVNINNGLTVTGWISLNWGLISVLAMHSFGRVIRRHEREALMSHPITRAAIARAANANMAARVEAQIRRRSSIPAVPSRVHLQGDPGVQDDQEYMENPFSDAYRLDSNYN